jgi:hypothetical protein
MCRGPLCRGRGDVKPIHTFWDEEKQQSELRIMGHVLVGSNAATFAVMTEFNRMQSALLTAKRMAEKLDNDTGQQLLELVEYLSRRARAPTTHPEEAGK